MEPSRVELGPIAHPRFQREARLEPDDVRPSTRYEPQQGRSFCRTRAVRGTTRTVRNDVQRSSVIPGVSRAGKHGGVGPDHLDGGCRVRRSVFSTPSAARVRPVDRPPIDRRTAGRQRSRLGRGDSLGEGSRPGCRIKMPRNDQPDDHGNSIVWRFIAPFGIVLHEQHGVMVVELVHLLDALEAGDRLVAEPLLVRHAAR